MVWTHSKRKSRLETCLNVQSLSLELLKVSVKLGFALLQRVVGFLLQVGEQQLEAAVQRLYALNVGQSQTGIGLCSLQHFTQLVQPAGRV